MLSIDQEQLAALRRARDEFLETGRAPDAVRGEIVASWRRSLRCGVCTESGPVPCDPELEGEERLRRAARPVLARLGSELAGTGTSLLLADRRARIVERWADDLGLLGLLDRTGSLPGAALAEEVAGTNGLGTAIEARRPVRVTGGEHLADRFQPFTCVGVPLHHPLTRQVAGVVDLTCRAEDTNPLLLPLVLEAQREIETRLAEQVSERDRRLLSAFLAAVRASGRPVIALNERVVIANPGAARLLEGVSQAILWEHARRSVADGAAAPALEVAEGVQVALRARAADGDHETGWVVELDRETSWRHRSRRRPTGGAELPPLVGSGPAWRQLVARALAAERTGLPLLLTGEPGAGKAALGRALHARRGDGTELAVRDARVAPVEGPAWWTALRAALADPGATVMVRAADALDSSARRALVGLVTEASRRALLSAREGLVEGDAWGAPVPVPALRDRLEDVPGLLAHLTRRHGGRVWWSSQAVQALLRLPWPGNVAQLEQLVRRVLAVRSEGEICITDLPVDVLAGAARRPLARMEQAELRAVLEALAAAGGNKVQAATLLGISRARLYRKLRASGLDLEHTTF